jgi:hypothetical protein
MSETPAKRGSGASIRPNSGPDSGPDLRSKDRTRRDKIAIVAYYHAQRRGFCNSGELDDWLSAERESDRTESGRSTQGGVEAKKR